MQNSSEQDEYLTDAQVGELLGVTVRTTMRWRRNGGGPPYVRVGPRGIRYCSKELHAWLASRTFPHRTAEAVAA